MLSSSSKVDDAFTKIGYSNWKNATVKLKGFQKHEDSDGHKEAVTRYVIAQSTAMGNAAEMLSEPYEKERATSRKMLLQILSNIRYLARQSLPMRGNWNEETKAEEDSNFSVD